MDKRLWEYDHPYYCTEGNFFHSPVGSHYEVHTEYDSWTDFFEDWGSNDPDLNLLFRWDWHRADPDDYEYEREEDPDFVMPGDVLHLYFVLQRKAFNRSVYVAVTENDEPAVREWLTERSKTMLAIWEPIIPERAR